MRNDILVKLMFALIFAMNDVLYTKDPTGMQSYRQALRRYGKN